MATAAKPKASKQSLYLLFGLAGAVLVGVLYLRHRNAALPQTETQAPSVGPGQDSNAPTATGGAASIPEQLPGGTGMGSGTDVTQQVQGANGMGSSGAEVPTALAAYYPELSPLGPTISHTYGDTAVYGQGGPVIDVDQLTSPSIIPSSTTTPTIPHPVGGGPQA